MTTFGVLCFILILSYGFSKPVSLKPVDVRPSSEFGSIVVFGASYCDNGHPRERRFDYSRRSPPYYQGRWSNGPVWVEYMAQTLNIPLFNYAYGGATPNNYLTNGGVPDTRSQIQAYVADIESGKIHRGHGKVLHLMWVGINNINHIWHSGKGVARVIPEAEEVRSQLSFLLSDRTVNSLPSEFHVLTLPPLQIVPNDAVSVVRYDHSAKAPGAPIGGIQMLTEAYNYHLTSLIRKLNSQTAFVHEIASFWYGVHSRPDRYGFTHVTLPCLSHLTSCEFPSQYVYFDSLHPTTKMHSFIGEWVLGRISEETYRNKKIR